MRVLKTWAWPVIVGALILAACGPQPAQEKNAGSTVHLSGTILGTGRPFGQGLNAYTLPKLQPRRLDVRIRDDNELIFGFDFLGAYWTDVSHVVTFVSDSSGSRLVEISEGGEPTEIGSTLTDVSGFDVRGGTVMATTCRAQPGRVWVMDLSGRRTWRSVGRSCQAALSPDGTRVAFIRHETQIWERAVDGGQDTRLFEVADVRGLRELRLGATVITRLAWGRSGVAAVVTNERSLGGFGGGRSAIVVHDGEGSTQLVPVPVQDLFLPNRPWQPNGDLLAFIARPSSGGSVMRLYDPASRTTNVVATDAQFLGNAAWSPDGRALAATTSANAMLFVDPSGNWISRVGTGGIGLLDWRA
jgi:hypothetical protein